MSISFRFMTNLVKAFSFLYILASLTAIICSNIPRTGPLTSGAILRGLLTILLVLIVPILSSGSGLTNLVNSQITNVSAPGLEASQTYPNGNVTIRASYVNTTRGARRLGRLAANKLLKIVIALKFRNGTNPEAYVQSLYDPSSPNYHNFLTPTTFANMFAPSVSDYNSIVNWLSSQGFSISETEPDRLIIEASAQAKVIEAAFGVDLSVYQRGNMTFYTNTALASAPLNVGRMISGIVGLHNLTIAHVGPDSDSNKDPVYTPPNLQSAYDESYLVNTNNLDYTGAGQTIDILDFYNYPDIISDLDEFDTIYLLPNPPAITIIPRGSPGSCPSTGNFCVETAIDTEWSHAMAPGATLHVILEPSLTTTAVTDGITYVVNTDLTTGGLFTNSYGGPEQCSLLGISFENGWTSTLIGAVHQLFVQAAAQGISTFFSSGDTGAYQSCGTGYDSILTVSYPASDDHVTAVGGTSLASLSPRSETAWSVEQCAGGVSCSSGGGVSAYFPEPTYQSDDGISLAGRGIPDVAADADPNTGVSIYCTDPSCPTPALNSGWGGTSLAAPLWAGSTAVLNQATGQIFGFLNPLIYAIYGTSEYSADFYDITSGNNGYYSATTGWDAVTGLGSPNLFKFAQNRGMEKASLNPTVVTQEQTVAYTGAGFTPNIQVTVAIYSGSGGLYYIVGTPTATNSGTISGSFVAGTNILPGNQPVTFTDTSTNDVVTANLQVQELTITATQTLTSTTTSITSTLTSSTSMSSTTTTTTTTSTSTTVSGYTCVGTTTTTEISVTPNVATSTTSTTSTTTTTSSTTSTYLTTTAFTSTSTSTTVTTTTTSACTLALTSTSTTSTTSTTLIPKVTLTVSYEIIGGGTPLAPSFNYVQGETPKSYTLTSSPTDLQVDAGTAWSVTPNPLSGSSSTEQWSSNQPMNGIASAPTTIVFSFYHQYLEGLSFSVINSTVTTSTTTTSTTSSSTCHGRGCTQVPQSSPYSQPIFTANTYGVSNPQPLTTTPANYWYDDGSTWSVTDPLGGSSLSEQWVTSPSTGTITAAGSLAFVYQLQYYLTMQVSPSGGGSTEPNSGWQNAGAAVALTESPYLGFKFSSWTCTGNGCYAGTSISPTVTMSNAITETANYQQTPMFGQISSVASAGVSSAWIVMPDFTAGEAGSMHTSAGKCGPHVAALATDVYAATYFYGALTNPQQNEVLDTNSAYVSQSASSCGEPTMSASQPLIAVAGPVVNEVVGYYESTTAPLYYNVQTGCIVRRDTGANVDCSTPTAKNDVFVMETFTDSAGRTVFIIYGRQWGGTLAGFAYLVNTVLKNPSSYTASWYVYRWQDATSGPSANGIPDPGDTYTLIALGP
jgi:kumamolisin